jgi:hypothetical protein
MNHTATPWEIVELEKPMEPFGSFIIRAPEAPGGIAVTINGLGDEERANAHLMGAAAEMYEALKAFSDFVHARECQTDAMPVIDYSDVLAYIFPIRAALAKTEGAS